MQEYSVMEFPMDFPIKVMGEQSTAFHVTVRDIIEKYTGELADEAFAMALSRNERFVSITVTITAESREQLDSIYRELSSHQDVRMAL